MNSRALAYGTPTFANIAAGKSDEVQLTQKNLHLIVKYLWTRYYQTESSRKRRGSCIPGSCSAVSKIVSNG